MFLSSAPGVLKAKKDGKLGSLNPTPFVSSRNSLPPYSSRP